MDEPLGLHSELSRLIFAELNAMRSSLQVVQADVSQIREKLAELGITTHLLTRLERDLGDAERRLGLLEDVTQQGLGAGKVIGAGGRWTAGIIGALLSALLIALVLQFIAGGSMGP